ncbi:DUF2057 domain-containing protein [Shewanella avicenniae]|uniref:DUF2057 domain-containing protein n=1 Tax=Shewanella avicenniae TaxID=2814294 RepID=A0ABX7QTV3_9GAMM|nr:DUF2057 domain-containing protein [Shewanella avicenniae]QSX34917.1 DUF2057 domain-containing protein [Shewanella avicenniae]
MKPLMTVSALFALICSSSAFAANFKIPMSFEYLALDGTQIETNHFTHKAEITLSGGTHKLAIRYNDVYDDPLSESPNFVKSSPFIITINVDESANYELAPAQKIIDSPAFAKSPKIVISQQNGAAVDYSVQQTDIQESSFIGKLFNGGSKGPDVDTVAAAVTAGKPIPQPLAAQPTAVEAMTAAPVATTAQPSATTQPTQAEQMLQYWWQQADEKTRKEFMSWAIKQL